MIDEPFSPRIEIRRRSPWYEKTPRGFSPKKNILHHLNSRLFHTSHLECCEFHKNCRGPTIHKIYTFIYLNLESATDVKIDKNHPHKQNIKCSFHTKHSLRIYTHNQLIQYTIHNNCTHLHRSQARRISVSFFFLEFSESEWIPLWWQWQQIFGLQSCWFVFVYSNFDEMCSRTVAKQVQLTEN